jgi:hypothetical protein
MRGPRSTSSWTTTDEKKPSSYKSYWKPGRPIRFDGTIDKGGDRHTIFGVALDEKDVLALHAELMKHFQEGVSERDKFAKTIDELEVVLRKISSLVSWQREQAPDTEALLEAVENIADHFAGSWNRDKSFKPRAAWLKWDDL